jgi:hypothetical protein
LRGAAAHANADANCYAHSNRYSHFHTYIHHHTDTNCHAQTNAHAEIRADTEGSPYPSTAPRPRGVIQSPHRRATAAQRGESLIPIPETQSAFHPHAQHNAFRRRDARLQSRLFARKHDSAS